MAGNESARISRAEALSRRLEQEIVDTGMRAGERLGTKEEIRKRFGYAVATVNEALRLLEVRGMIEARPGPGGGVFVASPAARVRSSHVVLGFKVDDAPFGDCLAVRDALEPLVCREGAAHCRPADAKGLRKIIARMGKQRSNPAAFLRLNWDLHRRLAKIGTNVPLTALYLALLDFVEDGLGSIVGDEAFDVDAELAIHGELVEAVIDGDPRRLAKAVAAHERTAERWTEGY
jgi:DNA-binding FadR family transcriptional regulator